MVTYDNENMASSICYGRVDGMYTRKMLIDSLTEQKQMTGNLQKFIAQIND